MSKDKVVEWIVTRLGELDTESEKVDEERKDLYAALHVLERFSETGEDVSPANDESGIDTVT